jgi:hypothetical protein
MLGTDTYFVGIFTSTGTALGKMSPTPSCPSLQASPTACDVTLINVDRKRYLLPPHTNKRPAPLIAIVWYKPQDICKCSAVQDVAVQERTVQQAGDFKLSVVQCSHLLDVVWHELPLFLNCAVKLDFYARWRIFLQDSAEGAAAMRMSDLLVLSDACLPRVARLNSKLLSCLGRKVRVYTELRAPNKHRPQT